MKKRAAISYQRSVVSVTVSNTELRAERRKLTASKAFSLVEVTLALAVATIGLVAILGLIPRGVQSGRDAADNTLAATISHDILNAIRTQPFTAVNLNPYGFPVFLYDLRNTYPGALPTVRAYFDQSGLTPATAQDDYFRVDLTFEHQTPPTPAVLSLVTVTVTWPANQSVVWPLNTNVFVTQIVNYQ